MTLLESTPYQNLVLTGPMGSGKTSVGRAVANRLGAKFFDLENEILAREGQSVDSIRELFGEARIKALETTVIRDLTLNRSSVLVISGTALLDETNRARLVESGAVLCLTCAVNEILRRQHMARGAWFQSPANRGVILSRLKREWRVTALNLAQLDTSQLTLEQTIDAVIDYWKTHTQV
jgi:shikimate kinase